LAPYAQFSVHQNRVERDPLPADQPLIGEWFALVTAGISDPNTGVAHTGAFATIAVDARTIVLGAGRPTVSTFTAAAGKPESPRGSVLGNVLNARSGDSTPAVRVIAAEECLFNDNRVELLGDSSFAVELVSGVAIVNANRVLGGKTNSIDIERARSAAVVGNITSMGILVDHVALKSPWKQLNIPDLSF
jgi:hypothetical protein